LRPAALLAKAWVSLAWGRPSQGRGEVLPLPDTNKLILLVLRYCKSRDISRVYYENGNNKDECINLTHPFILYPRLEKYQMGDSGFQIICQGVTEEYLDNNKRGAP
jgi:hypothetical protein